MIEPIGTVSPDITHEEFVKTVEVTPSNQFNDINVVVGTEEPNQMPPKQNILKNDISESEPRQGNSIEPEIPQTPTPITKKRDRKPKKSNLQEDNNIDDEFASRLDMSCADAAISAPQIENAHVADYIR